MEVTHTLPKSDLNQLPITSGVYLFFAAPELKNEGGSPIYIGKAINIKERVKNHFFQPNYKDDLYIDKVNIIGFIPTNSEIEALVLEASLIKKHQPKFNSVWRDDKNYFYVAITGDSKPVVTITHQIHKSEFINHKSKFIGPFVEGNSLKRTLKYLRRAFPYYTTTKHPQNKCTWCHLGLCPGPNPNLAEYKQNMKKLALILEGKRKTVLYSLKKEMTELAKANKFEEAGKIRDRISALEQVMSHTHVIESQKPRVRVIPQDQWQKTQNTLRTMLKMSYPIHKIECYDISNIQGTQAVGSMVVFLDGNPDKSQYKKFRIRMENKPNDIAMLKEVLTRRLTHPEWGFPDVILIDGGIAQLNIGIKTKEAAKANNIKIISIAKGKRELLIEGQQEHLPLKNLPQEIYNLIVHLDDEAHRFAITYHKKLRKKALLDPNP